jgi:uncharacterized protein YktB (UPF0637 family)
MAKAGMFEKRLAALEKTITDFFRGSSRGAKKKTAKRKAVKKKAAKKTAKKKTAKRKR